ncbi:MAG: hypothetical protein NDI88_11250, partial [Lysobacter sp.]|nr:hypothetical protein [Lysobacter sp.]
MLRVLASPTRVARCAAAGALLAASCLLPQAALAAPTAADAAQPRSAADAMVGVPDFSRITKRYGPAVVNISVSGMRQVT